MYLVHCYPFSVATESMQKWVGKQVLSRFSDVRKRFRCVFLLQFDWLIYFYHYVVFEKGREARIMLEGEEVNNGTKLL
jgi:hypothetical protein